MCVTSVHVRPRQSEIRPETELLAFRNGRAAGEFLQVRIADVAHIIKANLAGKKSVGCKLAKELEELNSLPQTWIEFRILLICNHVENLFFSGLRCSRDRAFRSGRYKCYRATSCRRPE